MAGRRAIVFKEFKRDFINHTKGEYYPVHIQFDENENGNFLKLVKLDMICEWRLDDGKILFLTVAFSTQEELNEILDYCKKCLGFLHHAIKTNIDDIEVKSTTLFRN